MKANKDARIILEACQYDISSLLSELISRSPWSRAIRYQIQEKIPQEKKKEAEEKYNSE